MAATLTTLASALKVFQIDGVNEQLNAQSVLYSKFIKSWQTDASGKSYTYFIRTARNLSAGIGISDGGSFGTPGNQAGTTAVIPNAYITTGIELTGPFIRAARNNVGAFVQGVKFEVDGASDNMVRAINRQLHSDGTDALAFLKASDNTTPSVIDDGQTNAFVHLDNAAMTLDFISSTDNSTVTGSARVVTLGAESSTDYAVAWTGGDLSASTALDYLILSGTLGKQLMGIRGIISASDPPLLSAGLHGIAASTGYWKAQSFTNSGTKRALTLGLMQRPLSQIGVRSAFTESDIKFLMGNAYIKDKYISLCVAEKRHVNEMELDGGQTAVTFNNKPFIVDPQCKRNTIFYVNPKTMDLLSSSDGVKWAEFLDGSQFKLKPGSSTYADAYQAFLVLYANLACKNRNGNAVLGDVDETVS